MFLRFSENIDVDWTKNKMAYIESIQIHRMLKLGSILHHAVVGHLDAVHARHSSCRACRWHSASQYALETCRSKANHTSIDFDSTLFD